MGPPWIGLVCPAHPTDAPLEWDVGNTSNSLMFSSNRLWTILHWWRAHCVAERGHSHQLISHLWKGAHGLQQYWGRWYLSKQHPHGWPKFPSTASPKPSHYPDWIVISPYCILVPGVPKGNNTHAPGHPHDLKENVIHQTPWFIAHMPIVLCLDHC